MSISQHDTPTRTDPQRKLYITAAVAIVIVIAIAIAIALQPPPSSNFPELV